MAASPQPVTRGVVPTIAQPFDVGKPGRYAGSVFEQLLKKVLAQYRLDVGGVHGVRHWGRVLENGRRLAPLTGADLRVVELFSIFHDACRWRDMMDHDHGHRAAELVQSLRGEIDLDDDAFALLVLACDCHTRGPRFPCDETVLTCLDADRLDIPRVWMPIRPNLLFTTAARNPVILGWAGVRAWHDEIPAVCADEWSL
jgi:uncharacterized protein